MILARLAAAHGECVSPGTNDEKAPIKTRCVAEQIDPPQSTAEIVWTDRFSIASSMRLDEPFARPGRCELMPSESAELLDGLAGLKCLVTMKGGAGPVGPTPPMVPPNGQRVRAMTTLVAAARAPTSMMLVGVPS